MGADCGEEGGVGAEEVEVAGVCFAFGVADAASLFGVVDAEMVHEAVEAETEVLAVVGLGEDDAFGSEGIAVGGVVGAEGVGEGAVEIGDD